MPTTRGIDRAVSRRPLFSKTRVQPQANLRGIVVKKLELAEVCPPSQYNSTTAPYLLVRCVCIPSSYSSVSTSVCPHSSARLLLDGFLPNLIFRTFMKICWGNPNLVKIGQNIRHFTWRPQCVSHCYQLRMQRKIKKTHCFMCKAPFRNTYHIVDKDVSTSTMQRKVFLCLNCNNG
jgi:hypothetical protein